MTTVLVDGSHLMRRDQTGIASYARTLAATLHELGAEVSLLLGSRTGGGVQSEVGLAGQVLGNAPTRGRIWRWLQLLSETRCGLRGRLRAVPVSVRDIDIASRDPPLPAHHKLFNASDFFDHA